MITSKRKTWAAVVIGCFCMAIGAMSCGDGEPAWIEVNEESLIGDWESDDFNSREDYGGSILLMIRKFLPDGTGGVEWLQMILPTCYWEEDLYTNGIWSVERDDTISFKYSDNEDCMQNCVGTTQKYQCKVSSNTLRIKSIYEILTSGDTIFFKDAVWETYRRVDASHLKAKLKTSYPLPVFSIDASLIVSLWVNNVGNKSIRFGLIDTAGNYNEDAFEYTVRNTETGDSTVYFHLNTGYSSCGRSSWYTKNNNRLILKNVTANGVEDLSNWEFEYSITTSNFRDVLTMRRIRNGQPVGDFETYERVCHTEWCRYDDGNLSKRLNSTKRFDPKGRIRL